MPSKSPILKIFAVAAATLAVLFSLALIVDKLLCHLITFYAAYRAPHECEAPDSSQTEEYPFCPDAAR